LRILTTASYRGIHFLLFKSKLYKLTQPLLLQKPPLPTASFPPNNFTTHLHYPIDKSKSKPHQASLPTTLSYK
jgi:hypothetical protein